MNNKFRNIIGWTVSGIVLLLLTASAIDKIIGSAHALEMTRSFGITPVVYRTLGMIELTSVILFIFPRTGVLGLLLLSSYIGGAIATHLQHGQSIVFPSAIEALIWVAALIRYPFLWRQLTVRG
ncbi:DoxX family protein [Mucilaginibacter sp.]|jgi:hypothetical protein|uniref:DoxX family protein n=1 Tax=Mucilaginibacter sp. TaxID=1882438 RepID=UPI00356B5DF2